MVYQNLFIKIVQSKITITYNFSFILSSNSTGETPLHLAARNSNSEASKHLLEAGGDPNAVDCNGRTPLHAAIAADAKGVFNVGVVWVWCGWRKMGVMCLGEMLVTIKMVYKIIP